MWTLLGEVTLPIILYYLLDFLKKIDVKKYIFIYDKDRKKFVYIGRQLYTVWI